MSIMGANIEYFKEPSDKSEYSNLASIRDKTWTCMWFGCWWKGSDQIQYQPKSNNRNRISFNRDMAN